jgi:pimeloyl-ACP methyl ester carboxylesterase
VSRAVLISTAGMPFDPPPLRLLLTRRVEDAREAVPLLFAEPPFVPWPVLHVSSARRVETPLDLLRSALSGAYLLDGLAAGMVPPTLVLFGAEDGIVPPSVGERLAASSPRIDYAAIEGASHMVVWEKPAWLAERIDAFLRAPRPSAASSPRASSGEEQR